MKDVSMYLLTTLKTQAQAEAPRLLLAVLALLIVGLLVNPVTKDFNGPETTAQAETPIKLKAPLKVSVAEVKR